MAEEKKAQAADVLGWEVLSPPFVTGRASRRAFTDFAAHVSEAVRNSTPSQLTEDIDAAVRRGLSKEPRWPTEDSARIRAAAQVLADLARQGWGVEVRDDGAVAVRPVASDDSSPQARKDQIRRQELVRRDQQLSEPAVQDFIRSMEKRRLFKGRFVSILSLMRDGRELSKALRDVVPRPAQEGLAALDKITEPYLQFVSDAATCEWTGLRLMDVWRYFRHTWVNQYGSVPGRSMMFLVRDAAAKDHPVMGIAAVSSPVVQLRDRDTWIGWHPETFIEQVREAPSDRLARWLVATLDTALKETFTRDFLEKPFLSDPKDRKARTKPLTPSELRSPSEEVIALLEREAVARRERHHKFPETAKFKAAKKGASALSDEAWEARARTDLYRSKRAEALAGYFRLRSILRDRFGSRPTGKKLAALLAEPGGTQAIQGVLRKAKADRVGVLMADISVCGAVQPYSALTGGKLVAMLATSPEVVAAYRKRYATAASEIASSMAGRAIHREPHLVFLSTTSLFGGSSQYNRISIPAERLGGRPGHQIRYIERGESDAYGTSQFSEETVKALTTLSRQSEKGLRVNSIFGEGQSPKLRKIREALDELGFSSDRLLKHGRRRVIYCIPLIHNVRDFLLGIDKSPQYIVPQKQPQAATSAIASWWKQRWLLRRIASSDVLGEVERHTLVYPVRHGARVTLPAQNPDQLGLFPGRPVSED